jgi:sugar phosphate permease
MVNLIDRYEWRMTIAILAIGLLAVCLPLSLLVRHKPEQYGYQPDGAVNEDVKLDDCPLPAESAEVNIKARQALKSRTFWHIALALLCQAMMVSTVVTHVMPYLYSVGIARTKSGLIAMAIPLASIGGRLGLGWLGDRLDKRRVIAAAFAMMCGGLICFAFASSEANWLLVPFLILFGIGYGGNNTLRGSAIREFFGRRNFGAIHGLVIGIMMLGGITGPPLAGWVFDKWGSYQPIWFVFTGLTVAAILLAVTTPKVAVTTPKVSTTIQPVDET